tara:strand:+ start:4234 stop:4902 length:669 start_codon:yes stop_codon:yes gene_type:complete
MFYSQDKQDKYLEENVFKGYKKGFYVDVGAHDGISFNNTLYFSNNNNWTGINIEPIKKVFDKLVINRPTDINLNCAISNIIGISEFYDSVIKNGTCGQEMLSGLKDNYDPRHLQRLNDEIKKHGGYVNIININVQTIESICDKYNIKHINYLSIDVEGAEFEVIKSINFDKVFIDVIGFENNYNNVSTPIIKYLEDKKFIIIYQSLDIFMIHKDSSFYPLKI